MGELRRGDLEACLDSVRSIVQAMAGEAGFGRAAVASLRRLVPGELTTLSVCNLETGHRSVVSDVPNVLSRDEIDAFDRHFQAHPLVREHARNRHARTRRISDLVPAAVFRNSTLFDEYYRRIRIDHAMAMPIHVDETSLVSFVFNRSRRDFNDRERARADAIRTHLGSLYRLAQEPVFARATQWAPLPRLTVREQEVLRWLSGGKTDRDIAQILAISPRTVHKHLQRVYEKLGVETRTAAVVRALSLRI